MCPFFSAFFGNEENEGDGPSAYEEPNIGLSQVGNNPRLIIIPDTD